jgi:hypothetical protein
VTLSELRELVLAHRFAVASEAELQTGVETVLGRAGCAFEREAAVGQRDRIDFLVAGIGIEIKVDGSLGQVTRQLHRYAQSECITSLLLVTTRVKHTNLPPTLHNKPLAVALLVGSAL